MANFATRRVARLAASLALVAAGFVGLGAALPALPVGAAAPKAACVPSAVADAYSTPEGTPLVVADPGVTTNDILCGTDGLVNVDTQPSFGTLDGIGDSAGGFTYTPDPGYAGPDSFTYDLEDVAGHPSATVSITVTPSCVLKVADDAYSTTVGTALVVPDPGVLANDTTCGDNRISAESSPSHGTLVWSANNLGGFTYTPDPGFSGADSFTYSPEESDVIGTVRILVVPAPTTTTTGPVATTASPPTSTPTVTTGPALARTGSPLTIPGLLGLGLVSIGLGLVLLARRRTTD